MRCSCGHVESNIDDLPEVAETIPLVAVVTVGAALTRSIQFKYGITGCASCRDLARKMDTLGPSGCRENLADLAEQLQSNASRLNWTQMLAAAMHPVSTTTGAIQAYRDGLAFYERLILDACEMTESAQDGTISGMEPNQ